jgi:hypothetical protein
MAAIFLRWGFAPSQKNWGDFAGLRPVPRKCGAILRYVKELLAESFEENGEVFHHLFINCQLYSTTSLVIDQYATVNQDLYMM